jgi:hypothetical protein
VAGIVLLVVLALGALVVTTDWSALTCFDGDEPGCADLADDDGLGAVQFTSWLIAAAACVSLVAAAVMSRRMRRPAQLVLVLWLSVGVIAAAAGLVARV